MSKFDPAHGVSIHINWERIFYGTTTVIEKLGQIFGGRSGFSVGIGEICDYLLSPLIPIFASASKIRSGVIGN